MFNRIFSAMGVVAVSAMVLVGGVMIGGGAAKAAFVPWNTSASNGSVVPGDWYGASNADPSSGASGFYGSLTSGSSFTDTYLFDVASSASILFGMDTTYDNPASSGIGITDLKFSFKDAMGTPIIGDTMTYPSGVAIAGTTNFGSENWYRFGLSAGTGYKLVVTGNVLGNGGAYAASLTAVPLPTSALLFGTALFGIGALRRRKDKKAIGLAA